MRAGPVPAAMWGPWAVAALCAVFAQGCRGGGAAAPERSSAAAPIIAEASDDEERQGLEQARDDIDAAMRPLVEEKDAEIEKLRRENEALRARLKR